MLGDGCIWGNVLKISEKVRAVALTPLPSWITRGTALVGGLVALAVLSQLLLPSLGLLLLSPLHILIMSLVLVGTVNASKNAILANDGTAAVSYWMVAAISLIAFACAELVDVSIDKHLSPASLRQVDELPGMIFVAVSAFAMGAVPFVPRGRNALVVGLVCLSAFGAAFAVREMLSISPMIIAGMSSGTLGQALQLAGVLFLGLFVVASFRTTETKPMAWAGTGLLDNPSQSDDGSFVGTRSRQMFLNGGIDLSPRHPPVALAFKPGWQDVTFVLVMLGMLVWAARPVKRATGRGYFKQAQDMIRLWYRHRIDPPTYYAMDLYRRENAAWAPHLLTRFETKNGLLSTLNRHRANPLPGHEMNDKCLFAQACADAGIPHPQPFLIIDEKGAVPQTPLEVLQQDLFCKPRKTMGAKDTLTFKWLGDGKYLDGKGQALDIFGVFASVALKRKPMLVQPWLRNHEEVSGFAKDSLVAIRVVTVLNEQDEPEVTLAMTRLLSKLEPDWQHLPDGEYAAPINLETGEMGLFTGDNFKTALVRMTHHPVTGIAIKGRVLQNWPAIRDLALKAHRAFKHRVVVGWDVALTPDGPVMLEGNTNLDVMFLQRVHDCPAGDTRFGALLNYQVHALHEARKPKAA
jgi:Sugar-transfer associated ATP-grasp